MFDKIEEIIPKNKKVRNVILIAVDILIILIKPHM